jgi:hypothetical protein
MESQIGTITWVGKGSNTVYEEGLARAVLLLAEDGREVAGIKMTTLQFEGHVYELILDEGESNRFEGCYQKIEQNSKRITETQTLGAFLANCTDGSALLLGRSAWLEGGWEQTGAPPFSRMDLLTR